MVFQPPVRPRIKPANINPAIERAPELRRSASLRAVSNESEIPPASKPGDRIRFPYGVLRRIGHTRDIWGKKWDALCSQTVSFRGYVFVLHQLREFPSGREGVHLADRNRLHWQG